MALPYTIQPPIPSVVTPNINAPFGTPWEVANQQRAYTYNSQKGQNIPWPAVTAPKPYVIR